MRRVLALVLILNFALVFSAEARHFKYNLTVAAIFQDESPYMKEWIDYHRLVGVEHFILYNNNSTDDYIEVLAPYINEGVVELIQWPSIELENDFKHFSFTTQPKAYTDSVNRSRKTSKWLAIIDIDEYIVPVVDSTILECLEKRFANVSGLNINWQCYGTSNIAKLDPEIPMIGQLVQKMKKDHENNKHCKCIVRPNRVLNCENPHFCFYFPGFFGVDAKLRPCQGNSQTVEIDVIRINHYWTKDEDFFTNVKIPRYLKWGETDAGVRKFASQMNEEYDFIMKPYSLLLQSK